MDEWLAPVFGLGSIALLIGVFGYLCYEAGQDFKKPCRWYDR